MKKLQVTGDFMLVCPTTRVEFDPGVAVSVEQVSDFMAERVKLGQLAYVGGTVAAPVAEPAPAEEKQPVPTPPSKSVPVKRGKRG